MASLDRLTAGCQSGDYYESLVFYKTVLSRKINNRNKMTEAFTAISQGVQASWQFTGTQPQVAAASVDIASQTLKLMEVHEMDPFVGDNKFLDEMTSMVFGLYNQMPLGSGTVEGAAVTEGKTPLEQKRELFASILKVLSSKKAAPGTAPEVVEKGATLQAKLCTALGAVYAKEGNTRNAYTHLLNGYWDPTGLELVDQPCPCNGKGLFEKFLASQIQEDNASAAAWVARATFHVLLRDKTPSSGGIALAQDTFNLAPKAPSPLKTLTQSLIALATISVARTPKAGGDSNSASEDEALAKLGDTLYEQNEEMLKATDEHLVQLVVLVLQRYKVTLAHKKAADAGGFLSMLLGGGSK